MRSRLLALALAAAAAMSFALVQPAAASNPHPCSGTVDRDCYTYDCTRNCFRIDCEVYVNLVAGTQQGCVG